ncbi:predicted protein [Lichtheimia corymbifera JMRC:FSU:9682]|uniref:Uncharacterized protein n=1 Tax=Lichtheimia corymbifera JMRC:FSU:9682 TaxID=1263082 RepID=A0A068RRE8_9FUNG|nr:predicted protein [Lichtheimia corymbifera JMRC:FSU:9682]
MSPPAKVDLGSTSNFFSTRLVVTLRNLGLASLIVKLAPKVRFTPTSNFVRLKSPRFIEKFRETGTFMFYICCKREARSLFIVSRLNHIRTKDAEGLVRVTKPRERGLKVQCYWWRIA